MASTVGSTILNNMVTTWKITSHEGQTLHTNPENHLDTTTMVREIRQELEDIKRNNIEEIEFWRQENIKLKRKLEDKEDSTVVDPKTEDFVC